MKTVVTDRMLKPAWKLPNDKTGQERESLSQRKVQVVEFGDMDALMEFAARSGRHEQAIIDMVNSQLHIRFGSIEGRNSLLGVFKPETDKEEVNKYWLECASVKLDYVAAFDAACLKEKKEKATQKSAFELFLATQPADKQAAFALLSDEVKAAKEEAFNAHMAAMSI